MRPSCDAKVNSDHKKRYHICDKSFASEPLFLLSLSGSSIILHDKAPLSFKQTFI